VGLLCRVFSIDVVHLLSHVIWIFIAFLGNENVSVRKGDERDPLVYKK